MVEKSEDSVFGAFFGKGKLQADGSNFLKWEEDLIIALTHEKMEHLLDQIPIQKPKDDDPLPIRVAYTEYEEKTSCIKGIMLLTMASDLQDRFMEEKTYDIIQKLREMFKEEALVEQYETAKVIFESKLEKGKPVGPHIRRMIGLIEDLVRLGIEYPVELAVDQVLHSLHDGFDDFRSNFKRSGVRKSLSELHEMLVSAEKDMVSKGTCQVLMVQGGKKFKKVGKGKQNKVQGKATTQAKLGPSPDQKCFHCNGSGHWKRNCPKYLKQKREGTSGIKREED